MSKTRSIIGPKSATQYVIIGKTDNVRAAAAQFEKILGLDAGSSTITLTTAFSLKSSASGYAKNTMREDSSLDANLIADGGSVGDDSKDRSSIKPEEESESGVGISSGGKFRKRGTKKGGRGSNARKNSKDGPSQSTTPSGNGGSEAGV